MQKKDRIIRKLRIIMPIVGIITTIVIAPLDLIPAWIAPLPDTVQQQLDESIEHGLDGIIVYVDQPDSSPVFYTAGLKNKSTQKPADPYAYFKIGSIHKLYIATAVAKLVNNGSMSLDDTLVEFFPEFDGRIEFADQITLKMMVQHRSGIPNFTDHGDFDWFTPAADRGDVMDLIFDEPADFKPDESYSYSNTNYLFLGRILDKVLGYSHHQYVYNDILAPLGLQNTFFSIDEVAIEDIVSGYWYEYDDDFKNHGGSMIATVQDVGIFLRALNNGSLLNPKEQAIYTSIYEYDHDGWVPGYHSMARFHEDTDTVVIQFVNTTGGATWGLADIVGGKATAISTIIYNRIVRILNK